MTMPTSDDRDALRDPRVDAAWRAASRDEPPPALDAAILAAARREAGAGPRSTRKPQAMRARRWWWPLAVAATLGAISVGLLQTVTPDRLGAPASDSAVVTDMPAQVAQPATEIAKPAPRQEASTPGGRKEADQGRGPPREEEPRRKAIAQRPLPRTDAPPSAAPAAAAPAETKRESTPRDRDALPEPFPAARDAVSSPQSAAPPVRAPPPPAMAAGQDLRENAAVRPSPVAKLAAGSAAERSPGEASGKVRAPLPVAEWIALIRRLRAEGNTVDAARELAAFRAAHVDHERLLPPDLRDWRPPEK